MAISALLQFTQGSNVGSNGQALVVTAGTVVVLSNSDNSSVQSYRLEVCYAPPESAYAFEPGVFPPTVIAEGNGVPAFNFLPETGVYGCYRFRLTTWSGPGFTGQSDVDIRCIAVPFPNGLIAPPYQKFPDPLPLLGSGTPGAKPGELNFGGQPYGWQGDEDPSRPLLWQTLQAIGGGGSVSVTNPVVGDGTAGSPLGLALADSTLQITGSGLSVGQILDANVSGSAGIQAYKLAPGGEGTVFMVSGGVANWEPQGAITHGNLSGLDSDDHVQYLLVDGTRGMSGSLNMNNNSITNVPTPIDSTDVANKAYADSLAVTAGNGLTGTASFSVVAADGTITVSSAGVKVGSIGATNIAAGAVTLAKFDTTGAAGTVLANAVANTPTWTSTPALTSLSLGTSHALTGALQLANAASVSFRNAANSADLVGLTVDSNNNFNVGPYNLTNLYTNVVVDPSGWTIAGAGNNASVCTFSVNAGTRTLTVTPVSTNFTYYVQGQAYTSTAQSVVWTATEGLWYFYFDNTNTLKATQSATTWASVVAGSGAGVAILYWDNTNAAVLDLNEERHGTQLSGTTHSYLHLYFHTQYNSGLALGNFTIGNGSSNTHAQFSVANGVIADEDITVNITSGSPQTLSTIAQIPIFYLSGATPVWRKKTADNYPLIQSGAAGYTSGAGRAAYNQLTGGSWQLTDATQGNYFHVYYFATNDVNTPIIGVLGQATYGSLAASDTAVSTEAAGVLSFLPALIPEYKLIAAVVFQTSSAYSNAVSTRIVQTVAGGNYYDYRSNAVSAGIGSAGSNIAYSSLTGQPTLTGTAPIQVAGNSGTPQTLATNLTISISATPNFTSVSLGATPSLTGSLQLTNATYIGWRNGTNSGDILAVGVDSSGNLQLTALATTGQVSFNNDLQINTKNILGVGYATFGAHSSTAGAINFANGQYIYARNAADSLDLPLMGTGSSNNLNIGSAAHPGNIAINVGPAQTIQLGVNGNYVAGVGANGITTGATPAATGAIALSNAQYVYARNAANSLDLRLLGTDASNNLNIGGASHPGTMNFNVGSSQSFAWGIDVATVATLSGTGLAVSGVVTATSSVTAGATQASGTTISATGLTIGNAVAAPTISQTNESGTSQNGYALTIQAQNATGTTSTGGNLVLTSGTGTTAAGNLLLQTGGTTHGALSSTELNLWPGGGTSSTGNIFIRSQVTYAQNSAIYFNMAPSSATSSNYTIAVDAIGDAFINSYGTYVNFSVENTQVLVAGVTGTSVIAVSATNFVSTGGAPALSGALRLTNNTALNYRNAAQSADYRLIASDASNNVNVGDTNTANATISCASAGGIYLDVGGTTYALITNTGVAVAGQVTATTFVSAGATPASSGALRLTNNTSISARNHGGTADISLIGTDSSDNVQIGNAYTTNVIIENGASGIVYTADDTFTTISNTYAKFSWPRFDDAETLAQFASYYGSSLETSTEIVHGCFKGATALSPVAFESRLQTTAISPAAYIAGPISRGHQHTVLRLLSSQTTTAITPFEIASGWMYQGTVVISRGGTSSNSPAYASCGTSAPVPFIATYTGGLQLLMANSGTSSVSANGTYYLPGGSNSATTLITSFTAGSNPGEPGLQLVVPSIAAATTLDFEWEFSCIYTG